MLKIAIGIILGSAASYGWYRVVGCSTGTCPLTTNPIISTLYGGTHWVVDRETTAFMKTDRQGGKR